MEAPANVVRAIAGAPTSPLRDSLLAALGYSPTLDRVSSEQQRQGAADVRAWYDEKFTGEITWQ